MQNGPLIPGLHEFDRPRNRRMGWLGWTLAVVGILAVLVVAAGFVGGVGPLRNLGTTTESLQAVGYRPTATDTVIQVGVAMPATGLCRDDEISVVAFERSNRVEVDASVTRSRNGTCPITSLGGDVQWVDVALANPLGERTVIRTSDRAPLPRDAGTLG